MPARILFLGASDDTLRQRKQSDPNRARSSFEYYLKHLMPLKRTWFSKMSNVDYLLVDNMPRQEVAMRVKQWVDLLSVIHRLGAFMKILVAGYSGSGKSIPW